MNEKKQEIVIIGAGFGGLKAAQDLASQPVNITLLDRNNFHLFQPLMYQVASAYLEAEQIARPIRQIFRRQKNLTFRMTEVQDIDYKGKTVKTDSGDYPYDFLILAFGGTTNFFGLPGLKEYGFTLKSLEDTLLIRSHILTSFEKAAGERDPLKRKALHTIAIGGGGPSGVEMAGALAELVSQVLRKDYKEFTPGDYRIVLCEGSDRILPDIPADLASDAEKTLGKKGVEVLHHSFIESYDGTSIHLRGGEEVPAATLIWTAGVNAGELALKGGVETAANRRIVVNRHLQVPLHNEVYVIGDAAFHDDNGKVPPMVAPAAVQMAEKAVENILLTMAGKEARAFHYKSPGALATIGRNAAVAYIGGVKFKGFFAWGIWLVVHLIRLIGFKNRLMVLINWAWDYFFLDRASRLVFKMKKK